MQIDQQKNVLHILERALKDSNCWTFNLSSYGQKIAMK